MPGYDYQLSSFAVRTLFGSAPRRRRQALVEIDRIVAAPFQPAGVDE